MFRVWDIYIVVFGICIGGDFFSEEIIVFSELLCLCIWCSRWKCLFFQVVIIVNIIIFRDNGSQLLEIILLRFVENSGILMYRKVISIRLINSLFQCQFLCVMVVDRMEVSIMVFVMVILYVVVRLDECLKLMIMMIIEMYSSQLMNGM